MSRTAGRVVPLTRARAEKLYRYEAEHILGHALVRGKKSHEIPAGRTYCEQCIGMIVAALKAAERMGASGKISSDDVELLDILEWRE